jgi:hypothetical protein
MELGTLLLRVSWFLGLVSVERKKIMGKSADGVLGLGLLKKRKKKVEGGEKVDVVEKAKGKGKVVGNKEADRVAMPPPAISAKTAAVA